MHPDASTMQVSLDLYHILISNDGFHNIIGRILLTMHNIQNVSYEQILAIYKKIGMFNTYAYTSIYHI